MMAEWTFCDMIKCSKVTSKRFGIPTAEGLEEAHWNHGDQTGGHCSM